MVAVVVVGVIVVLYVLGGVVVVALMAVFLAEDRVSLDRRERFETVNVGRDRSHIGTLAKQRVLARATRRRTGELLDTTTHANILLLLLLLLLQVGALRNWCMLQTDTEILVLVDDESVSFSAARAHIFPDTDDHVL